MQKLLWICALILSAWSVQAIDIMPITEAFKTGNADLLKDKMASDVDLVAPGVSKKGSGSEAIAVLKTFFKSNKPTKFTVAHHTDKNDCGFLVGKLAAGGKEFRVNIMYTIKDDKMGIATIRIE
jgi:hypothetical protein